MSSLPSPLQVRDWVRANLLHLGIEKVAAELAALTAKCDEIGLPSPANSILVTQEVSKHWGLKEPRWSKAELEIWRTLPFHVAKTISDRNQQDLAAVRRLQQVDAYLRKRADKGIALLEVESKMKEMKHADH